MRAGAPVMNAVATRATVIRLIISPGEVRKGCEEVAKGVHLEVIEERSWKSHTHIRGSLPSGEIIESGFAAGPIFSLFCADSYVDVLTGTTIIDEKVLFESVVARNVVYRYELPSALDYRSAQTLNRDQIVLPLASARMQNYCHFWLDSIGKIFVVDRSPTVRKLFASGAQSIVAPKLKLPFQREAIDLLTPGPVWTATKSKLLQGSCINSSGVVFERQQNVGSVVRDFARYLDVATSRPASSSEASERVYVSRNEARMRRVLNEDDVTPGLRDLGFEIIRPGNLPLSTQIEKFRNAKVIVAPHGAALANLVFCQPGLTLVEIFPRGGLHNSMFMRIASHLDFDYYFVVGDSSPNAASKTNPNNADIVFNRNTFFPYLRDILQD